MKYGMVRPCAHCPFRHDIPGYLRGSRAREIAESLLNGGNFPCHETTVVVLDDEGNEELRAASNSEHCAGALIMLERMGQPNQMMRICERLGMYDMRKLDMASPVFPRVGEFIAHHAKATGG
jgi:hypothetical protein